MNTIQLDYDIPFRAEAEDADRFVRCFNEALDLAFNSSERETIAKTLDYVSWTNVEDDATAMAYVKRASVDARRGFAVFHARDFLDTHDRHLKRIVVHEMDHVIQLSTGYDLPPLLLEACKREFLERFADGRATKFYGPRSILAELPNRADYPSGEELDRLMHDWLSLKPDQREQLRIQAYEYKCLNREEKLGPM